MMSLKLMSSLLLLMLVCMHCVSAYNVTDDCAAIAFDELLTANNATLIMEQFDECQDDYADCPDPSVCHDSTNPSNKRVGLAFGLTIGAGLATGVGAIVPFFPCIKQFDTKFLTAALGLASGVMIYVSLADIFHVALIHFCCVSVKWHYLLNTASFFLGIFITVLLDVLVHALEKLDLGIGTKYDKCMDFLLQTICRRSPNDVTITKAGPVNGVKKVNDGKAVAVSLDIDDGTKEVCHSILHTIFCNHALIIGN